MFSFRALFVAEIFEMSGTRVGDLVLILGGMCFDGHFGLKTVPVYNTRFRRWYIYIYVCLCVCVCVYVCLSPMYIIHTYLHLDSHMITLRHNPLS